MLRQVFGGILRSPLVRPLRRLKAIVRPDSFLKTRKRVAQKYLHGEGIEVGALHNPLPTPQSARVRFVDRMSVEDLRRQYPDLATLPLVPVDIVSDGETLSSVPDQSQDFVIGNHFLEHCEDPIGTLKNFLRVVRPGGVVYCAVPDKRFTFDRDRPLTTLEHLIADHQNGPAVSRRGHYEEYAEFVHDRHTPEDIQAMADHLIEIGYSIHYHVWTQREVLELLGWLSRTEPFDVELVLKNEGEVIAILRKHLT
ncbi:MAG: class I SAM-dependent methyltransferase [Bacteroidales bacterium]|nr:class I SAM-dependent methyltransferase [Bacteroidales bacterium]